MRLARSLWFYRKHKSQVFLHFWHFLNWVMKYKLRLWSDLFSSVIKRIEHWPQFKLLLVNSTAQNFKRRPKRVKEHHLQSLSFWHGRNSIKTLISGSKSVFSIPRLKRDKGSERRYHSNSSKCSWLVNLHLSSHKNSNACKQPKTA